MDYFTASPNAFPDSDEALDSEAGEAAPSRHTWSHRRRDLEVHPTRAQGFHSRTLHKGVKKPKNTQVVHFVKLEPRAKNQ